MDSGGRACRGRRSGGFSAGLRGHRQLREESLDLARVVPMGDLCLRRLRDAREEIDTVEQNVDLRLAERQVTLLRGDEAVLHRVGHGHSGRDTDDACRALQ